MGHLVFQPEGDGAVHVEADQLQAMGGGERLPLDFHGLGGIHLTTSQLLAFNGLAQGFQGFSGGKSVGIQETLSQEGVHQGPGIPTPVQLGVELLDLAPLLELPHQGGALVLAAIRKGEAPAIQGLVEQELLQGALVL
ncbi:hypothetical protein GALL_456740 [mine drainage metagenome]|uniref:Uncharacterized protein n=1 Tax=mine drainage metagenome TaxID=410659 RepID=A0A1J5PPH1_9ZZZZ